ncbi:phosphate acetyltransferase [Niveispirillum sp. SYP-B3756]|uniref:phosphate acetyltransferase n=1 Tax=Niveispirillum sp. SYP-B3756 TaxID=2662178 RepID=UPI0012919EFA|nr:phosphate acetyltransferase [Niveispirillum sp. SYP-B3756]MQP64575.1 phosphate acetyltransferase [Niveispirillum sp. SYP-B3756]
MLKLGDSASITRIFTAADMADYVALGGAPMPEGEAAEPLVGALFSYLLGVKLPGPGTNYLKQQTQFLAPIPLGRALLACVTITRLRPDKHLVDLETVCELDGQMLAQGRALVYVEDVADKGW